MKKFDAEKVFFDKLTGFFIPRHTKSVIPYSVSVWDCKWANFVMKQQSYNP